MKTRLLDQHTAALQTIGRNAPDATVSRLFKHRNAVVLCTSPSDKAGFCWLGTQLLWLKVKCWFAKTRERKLLAQHARSRDRRTSFAVESGFDLRPCQTKMVYGHALSTDMELFRFPMLSDSPACRLGGVQALDFLGSLSSFIAFTEINVDALHLNAHGCNLSR